MTIDQAIASLMDIAAESSDGGKTMLVDPDEGSIVDIVHKTLYWDDEGPGREVAMVVPFGVSHDD